MTWRDFRERRYPDPVTGEPMTFAERMSWLAQGVIRRFTLLILITAGTLGIFVYTAVQVGPSLHAGDVSLLTWWNLWASWMALMIEGTVGIAMFNQTRRTVVVLRKIERMERLLLRHMDIDPDEDGS